MKTTAGLLCVLTILILGACVSKNPNYVPGNTNGIPAYVTDPRIEQSRLAAHEAAKPFDTINPYAGLTHYAIDAVLGITALISTAIAKKKMGATETMAEGIVNAGPTAAQAVLTHAADSPHFPAIAAAINDKLPAGKAPGTV